MSLLPSLGRRKPPDLVAESRHAADQAMAAFGARAAAARPDTLPWGHADPRPDLVVFGGWHPPGDPAPLEQPMECGPCQVSWSGLDGDRCWYCGETGRRPW